MAIQSARAYLDGKWYPLTYNPKTSAWQTTIIPENSSYNQPGGYFPVTIEATNDTGKTISVTGAENDWLKLQVQDKVLPSLVMVSDYAHGYVTSRNPVFVFDIIDEDSGVDMSTLEADIDSQGYAATITSESIENGHRVTYTATDKIPEGPRVFSVSVSDYEGNHAEASWPYVVDVTPPDLFIFSPNLNYIVDVESAKLIGKVFDEHASPVKVMVAATSLGNIELEIDGNGIFSLTVPLVVGRNDITVKATDSAGLVSRSDFYMLRLITNRTQADVDKIVRIMSTPPANWTEDEREIYQDALARGSYDYVDMNRVTAALEHIDAMFKANGIESGYERIKETWSENDIVQPSTAKKYLENVRALMSSIVMPDGAPAVPRDMEYFNFQEANDIEKILVIIDAVFYYIDKAFWYSNEIFCGEE